MVSGGASERRSLTPLPVRAGDRRYLPLPALELALLVQSLQALKQRGEIRVLPSVGKGPSPRGICQDCFFQVSTIEGQCDNCLIKASFNLNIGFLFLRLVPYLTVVPQSDSRQG